MHNIDLSGISVLRYISLENQKTAKITILVLLLRSVPVV